MSERGELTRELIAWSRGGEGAGERLFSLTYDRLRRIAAHLRRHRDAALQTTELVHEGFLRLAAQRETPWQSREHFFAIAGRMMGRAVVDERRRLGYRKRGGNQVAVPLDEDLPGAEPPSPKLLDLAQALAALGRLDRRQQAVVLLRLGEGCTLEETAALLGCSTATVTRDQRFARAWLLRALGDGGA